MYTLRDLGLDVDRIGDQLLVLRVDSATHAIGEPKTIFQLVD